MPTALHMDELNDTITIVRPRRLLALGITELAKMGTDTRPNSPDITRLLGHQPYPAKMGMDITRLSDHHQSKSYPASMVMGHIQLVCPCTSKSGIQWTRIAEGPLLHLGSGLWSQDNRGIGLSLRVRLRRVVPLAPHCPQQLTYHSPVSPIPMTLQHVPLRFHPWVSKLVNT